MNRIWRSILLSTTFMFGLALISPTALAASWGTPLRISNTGKYSLEPSIAISNNGNLHAAWTEWTIDAQGFLVDFEIYYVRSTDNGGSFSAPVNISSSPNNFSGEPVISVAGDQNNEIHIAWVEYNPSGDPDGTEIFYTRSTDGGATWPSANKRNVSSNVGSSGSAHLYVDSTPAHAVHVAWTDFGTGGYGQIHYSKSADGGGSFSVPLNIANSGRDTDQPSVIADSNAVHIVWQDNEDYQVYHTRSTNAGSTFSVPALRSSGAAVPAVEPALALDGQNRVHIAWTRFNDAGGSDISWAVSSDNGATFAASQNRSNNPSTTSQTPTISSPGGGRVVIIWSDSNPDGTTQNWSVDSPNGGSAWGAAEAIAGPASGVFEPSLVIKGSTLYLVWEEGGEVKFAKGS